MNNASGSSHGLYSVSDPYATGENSPIFAVIICLVGFFLKIILSGPLLATLLGNSASEGGTGPFSKIHPGSILIMLSFFVLIASDRNPLNQIIRIYKDNKIYSAFIVLYFVLILYWVAKDPNGVGILFDTHLVAPMGAIVLCYAPRELCRLSVWLFVVVAVINSLIGIGESIGQSRIFTFPDDWVVLHQHYFRATALLGHPLNNAMFTAIALFVTLSLRLHVMLRFMLTGIYLVSLVAFGGRGGLLFTVLGVMLLGAIELRQAVAKGLSLMKTILLTSAVLAIPIVMAGSLYLALNSSMGQRISNMDSLEDESANARIVAFQVFSFMHPQEITFGVSADRAVEIAYRMGLALPISDIENPWILMLMFLGILVFPFWLLGLAAYIYRLTSGTPLPLKMAVAMYFIIASTSNSFGRKDHLFAVLACIVTCAMRSGATSYTEPDQRDTPQAL